MPKSSLCPRSSSFTPSETEPPQTQTQVTNATIHAMFEAEAENCLGSSLARLKDLLSGPRDSFEKVAFDLLCPGIGDAVFGDNRIKELLHEETSGSVAVIVFDMIDNPLVKLALDISSTENMASVLHAALTFHREYDQV